MKIQLDPKVIPTFEEIKIAIVIMSLIYLLLVLYVSDRL